MKKASTEQLHRDATQAEQRIHRRHPTNLAVRVYWYGASGRLEHSPGVIRDISSGGFGAELEHPVDVGQPLSVQTREGALQCVVRHARPVGGRFFIGMEVVSASDGSDHERSLNNLALILSESKKAG